jgi:phage gpG-like protein
LSEIDIEVGNDQIAAVIASISAKFKQLNDVLDDIGNTTAENIRIGFEDGTDPYGAPWKPLAAGSRSGQPLRDTGRLMNSITHVVEGKNAVRVGTDVVYALQHQYGFKVTAQKPTGGSARFGYSPKNSPVLAWFAGGKWHHGKEVTIPARPFFPSATKGLPNDWTEQIMDVLSRFILPSEIKQ